MAGINDWTIMFFFAGDNQLAPIAVSLLKAIKDAGFQKDTDVVVYFDPNEVGVPTKVYNVNQRRKMGGGGTRGPRKPKTHIGDGADPFVRNIEEDRIKPDDIDPDKGPASAKLKQALKDQTEMKAEEALDNFIGFCREAHPARHYILYLVGHGMVVGGDTFLTDDNPLSAITLKRLGVILKCFTDKIKEQKEKGVFQLLGLHSCCMSAIEVAYELKGTANYMLASEGPTFLGDWHIRQLLKKNFNVAEAKPAKQQGTENEGADQDKAKSEVKILRLIRSLYYLTLFSGTDYLHAGYSHDLALCNLDPRRYRALTVSIKKLVAHLKKGLEESSPKSGSTVTKRGKRIKELVLLAHWEAQSYWGESYTDLFDFCRCLRERCDPKGELGYLHKACSNVMKKLTPITSGGLSKRFKSLVIYSNNFGWEFQYSHGLSVYFPWSVPVVTVSTVRDDAGKRCEEKYEDERKGILERYRGYAFTKELKDDSWLSFLEDYFKETERKPRHEEDRTKITVPFTIANDSFDPSDALSTLDDPIKPNPRIGADCTCPSIKNYPKDEHKRNVNGKVQINLPTFSMTKGVQAAFEDEREQARFIDSSDD
jgi:hypothetical protein